MAYTENVVDIVEKLIETCRDGQHGFRESAQHVKDPSIRELFNQLSLERAQFAGELESALHRLGKKDVKQEGSISGKLHRTWIDLKSNLQSGDGGILAAAENGEDNAKKHYQEAEQQDLPGELREIIARQAEAVFAAHDRVRQLRDAAKAA
jgi:uncharacterized protein (TIGR02284 family)